MAETPPGVFTNKQNPYKMFSFNSSDVFGAYEYMQEAQASVLRFNEANTDQYNRLTATDFYQYRADELSPSRKEFVHDYFVKFLMLSDADASKRCEEIVEAYDLVKAANGTLRDLLKMHVGHRYMIEGMSEARQDRIHARIANQYAEVLKEAIAALGEVMNFRYQPSEEHRAKMPTAATVADLHRCHGVWVDVARVSGPTQWALEETRDTLNLWIRFVRMIEFPQVDGTALVDECNEAAEATEHTPTFASLDMTEKVFVQKVMLDLAPKEVSSEDVGTEWEPNLKRLNSLTAMLRALEVTSEEAKAFQAWRASVETWNEKRALVAQG